MTAETVARTRVRFGPSALVKELNGLVQQLADGADASILDSLEQPMHERFQLTSGQAAELALLDADREAVARLRGLVAYAGASDGRSVFTVAHVPAPGSTLGFIHQLRLETVLDAPRVTEVGGGVPENMIAVGAIAHCDANCQDWGWG